MNNVRRAKLRKAMEMLEDAKLLIEEVRDEEQEAFDNMPESLQYTERGEKMEENIYNLGEQMDAIENAYDGIEEVVEA